MQRVSEWQAEQLPGERWRAPLWDLIEAMATDTKASGLLGDHDALVEAWAQREELRAQDWVP